MLTMGKSGLSRALDRAIACHAQVRQAETLYKRVLKADGGHFPAMHGLGVMRLQQRRFADAVSHLRRAIELDRTFVEAHHHLGFALIGLCSLEEAIRFLQKAIDLNRNFAEAYNNLGYALQRLGRTEQQSRNMRRRLRSLRRIRKPASI
jgi:Flp pilus assembly protein TadD